MRQGRPPKRRLFVIGTLSRQSARFSHVAALYNHPWLLPGLLCILMIKSTVIDDTKCSKSHEKWTIPIDGISRRRCQDACQTTGEGPVKHVIREDASWVSKPKECRVVRSSAQARLLPLALLSRAWRAARLRAKRRPLKARELLQPAKLATSGPLLLRLRPTPRRPTRPKKSTSSLSAPAWAAFLLRSPQLRKARKASCCSRRTIRSAALPIWPNALQALARLNTPKKKPAPQQLVHRPIAMA